MAETTIAASVAAVRERIIAACDRAGRFPGEVTMIAVTKGFGPDAIRDALSAGVRDFGENRVQEALAKRRKLGSASESATWHMIGHLQTNKVKAALGLFDIIHSVDSLHVAEAISRRAPLMVPVFIEVNVSGESSKFGFATTDVRTAYAHISRLPNIDVRGLMTVAPLSLSPQDTRPYFQRLAREASGLGLSEISMGMTDDFEVAIEEGATHIRIGRAIFGDRT